MTVKGIIQYFRGAFHATIPIHVDLIVGIPNANTKQTTARARMVAAADEKHCNLDLKQTLGQA
jgi:hypothetical protein